MELQELSTKAEPQFSMQWEGGEQERYGQQSMLDANRESDDVSSFVRGARIGDEERFGGGAAPVCTIRRVS